MELIKKNKYLIGLIKFVRHRAGFKHFKRSILNALKNNFSNAVDLSSDQKAEIDEYYLKNYGRKVPYFWHQYIFNLTGKFDVKFLPYYIYAFEIEPTFLNQAEIYTLANKSILPEIIAGIGGLKTPTIIASQTNPHNLRFGCDYLDFDTFCEKIADLGNVIIKPACDSMAGAGVASCCFENGIEIKTGLSCREFIKRYENNFVIQPIIKNCDVLRRVHPKSLNTMRVFTYRIGNEFKVVPPFCRFGVGDAYCDNAGRGGLCAALDPETGKIGKFATNHKGVKIFTHPDSGVKFEGIIFPRVRDIIEISKQIHRLKLPQFIFVSFDFTVDENMNIFLIELNLRFQSVEMAQECTGLPAFGNDTSYFLNSLRKK